MSDDGRRRCSREKKEESWSAQTGEREKLGKRPKKQSHSPDYYVADQTERTKKNGDAVEVGNFAEPVLA